MRWRQSINKRDSEDREGGKQGRRVVVMAKQVAHGSHMPHMHMRMSRAASRPDNDSRVERALDKGEPERLAASVS